MKQKVLIIATALFFLIVNTSYFWEGKSGFYAMPMSILLVVYYVVLAGIFFQQGIYLVREKFRNRRRLIITSCLLVVLVLTFLQPAGIIDFDKLSGKDVLIAQQEGVANCTTTLKLKDNSKFVERNICFGVHEIRGDYELKGDTIVFKDVDKGREEEYYTYGLIRSAGTQNGKMSGDLVLYKGKTDTSGYPLFIVKNELKK